MLFVSMIGGLGTIEGPIVGSIIFFALQQSLQQQGAWYLVIFGSVAVVVALWQPRGIWGAVRDRFQAEILPVGHWVEESASPRRRPWHRRAAESSAVSTGGPGA
jgi:branched-chain amino acid transport system permease protein